MDISAEYLIPTHDERGEQIAKFGRFVKDVVFMEPAAIESDEIDDYFVKNKLQNVLSGSDSLVMFDEHSYLLDSISADQGVEFQRISARSGQNSRHGVFFGTLFSEKYAQDVAVKVFGIDQGGATSVIEEVSKTNRIRQAGMKTFTPIGVGSYAGDSYSFWKLEPQVSTFDSIDWKYFIDDVPGNPGMASLFRKTARTAATLHANGWAHGDFHPRNLAVDITGSVFAIDWETAVLDEFPKDDAAVRYQRSYLDLRSFMTSCFYNNEHFNAGIGIFEDVDNEQSFELFKSIFLDHYIQERTRLCKNETELEDIPQLIRSLQELPDMIR